MQNISKEHVISSDDQLPQIKQRLTRILSVMAEVPAIDDVPAEDESEVAPSKPYQAMYE